MGDADKNKLGKAGYATPRGGRKGAYQNHVYRNNRVIIPYERIAFCNLDDFEDGYVIRLFPSQYFEESGRARAEFTSDDADVRVGDNAFVLYRTHEDLRSYPPLDGWNVRDLQKDGESRTRRGKDVVDTGEYVLRLPTAGRNMQREEGPAQGIFAPEYATADQNFLAQCVLAWLTVHTLDSPYTTTQAQHIKLILDEEGLADDEVWERRGILRHGLTACPLCSRLVRYSELHSMLVLDEEQALENAGMQIEGATRSTIVNLFHMEPMKYGVLNHTPASVAWGHATCNTKLGQRHCYSLAEFIEQGNKVGIIRDEGVNTFGWISDDWQMIRSPEGSVWIRLCADTAEGPPDTEECV